MGSKELTLYLEDQQKSAQRPYKTSNEKELKLSIENSDIILVGDFHTFDQNNKNFLRIINNLLSNNDDFVMAVEFIHHHSQHIIDAYLKDELTETEFLEEINYQDSWHFPWPHYKAFFDLAKEYNIKVIAINSDGTLPERDLFAAKIINAEIRKVLVFIGELHIVEDKLPKKLREMNPENKVLVIHQNLDDIYWDLKPGEYIIKFNDDEYSLQTSPPWIKYESLNYWFDYMDEDPDFEIHEHKLNQGIFLFSSNITDNFFDLCKKISEVLHLNISHQELEHFNLYDHQSLEIVLKNVYTYRNKELHQFLENQLISGAIFNLPNKRIYYCPTYSFNRLVLISGIHLYQIISDRNQSPFRINDSNLSLSYFTQKRVFSYLVSKIINPFRKCDRYQDIQNEDVKKIIDCNSIEELESIIFSLNLEQTNHIGQILGSYLGELLYEMIFLKDKKEYLFILDCIKETNYELETLFFIIRSIFTEKSYQSDTKRIF